MCGGGDDSDSGSDDSVEVGYGAGQVDPSLAAAAGYSSGGAGPTASVSQANTTPNIANYDDGDNYVNAVLASEGYSNDYKGVKSGDGSTVTDGFGNPVMSGSYVNTQAQAESDFQAYQEYQTARAEAQEAFYDDMEARQQVDQDLIDAAMGAGGYVSGDITDPNFDPTAVDIMQGPASLQDLQSYGNYLGSAADTFSFPEFSFADPYGTAMAPTVSQIDGNALGSNVTTFNEANYFDNFSEGYNDDAGFLGRQIENDAAGNVGFTSAGQRFGDAVGNALFGAVLGGVAGPLGSALGAATTFNNMDAYGENVPGFNPNVSTTSVGLGGAVGGLLGNQAANYVSPMVGQQVYGATGNPYAALGGAVATSAGMTAGGAALGSNIMGDMVMSNTSSPYASRSDELMEEKGFGSRLMDGGDDGGGSGLAPDAGNTGPMSQLLTADTQGTMTPTQSVSESGIQDVVGADVGTGDLIGDASTTEFDDQQFLLAQLENANPNTTQVTDFFGNQAVNLETNPLFSAAPAGVQYLTKGRQRNFGNAIFNVANRLQKQRGFRRQGLNDKAIGTVIG